MSEVTLDGPRAHLTAQFLFWLSERPRTYGVVMDVWRTSCPRLSVWEDAVSEGLVRLGDGSFRDRQVVLTERGQSYLTNRATGAAAAE